MRRRLRWDEEQSLPRHPFRDSTIFYGILAVAIVVITALTGGNLLPGDHGNRKGVVGWIGSAGAILIAAVFFVVAVAFSWWRWRDRAGEEKGP